MARPYRLQAEGCFYHITSRGDDRKPIFKGERDYHKFLEYTVTAKDRFKFYLHAYCLMANHYHLLIETTQANLSRIMQYLNTAYTIYYNLKHKRTGHLFQGRYKSILVEQESYFSELSRYIHLNPVRARIADSPERYRWSSYGAYIRGKDDGYVDIERVKRYLGMDIKGYRQFVQGSQEDYPDPLKDVYAGFILGGVKFIKEKLNQLQLDVGSKDFAPKRAIRSIVEPEEIINEVARYYKISQEELRYSKKRPIVAKRAAIYLLRRKTGLTNQEIGELFRMKDSAVSMAALDFQKKIAQDTGIREMVDKIIWKFEV